MEATAHGEVVQRTVTAMLTLEEVRIMIPSTPSNFHSNRDDVGQRLMTGHDVVSGEGGGSRNDAVVILGGGAFKKVMLYSM